LCSALVSVQGVVTEHPLRPISGRWRFLAVWVALSLLGWVLGGLAFAAVMDVTATGTHRLSAQIGRLLGHDLWLQIRESAALAAMGATLGLTQWAWLRREGEWTGHWIWATSGGLALGGLVEAGLRNFLHRPDAPFLAAISLVIGLGGGMGVLQWLSLRRQTHRSGWWIIASVAGALLGAIAVIGTLLVIDHFYVRQPCCVSSADEIIKPLVAVGMFGTLRETVTGLALMHILRPLHPAESPA